MLKKTQFSASITIEKTAGSLDEKILRGSADGLALLRVTLAGALPLELSA
jgi:hypothetical protein